MCEAAPSEGDKTSQLVQTYITRMMTDEHRYFRAYESTVGYN